MWIKYEAPYVYWPLGWIACKGPEPLKHQIAWYSRLFVGDQELALPNAPSGGSRVIFSK